MSQPRVQPIVIWFGRVGDMILMSALLEILHRRYGAPCHVIGAGAWPAQLYATHPDVAQVSCLHRYTAFLFDGTWWRTVRALRASRGAPVYVCEYYPDKMARVRRLLRFGAVDAARCLFITDAASMTPRHWVDRLVSFGHRTPAAFDPADYPWPSPPPRCAPRLEVSAGARAECAAWLAAGDLSARPLVLVQPGNRRTMRGRRLRLSAGDDKAWPVERWAELLQRLHTRLPQAGLLLCGAPRESLLLSWIAAAAHLDAVVPAVLPLPLMLGLCERAHSMISVDTGPAHAAAALSLPLVVMFGANSPEEWLPRSPGGSQVLAVGGPPHSRRLDEIEAARVFEAWCGLRGRELPQAADDAPDAPQVPPESATAAASLTPPTARATAR